MSTTRNSRRAILVLVFILVFVINYEIVKAQTPSPPYQIKIIVDSAKLRTGPGTNFPSSGFANKGDILTVHQISLNGEWLLVYQNPDLWIFSLQTVVMGEGNITYAQPTLANQNLTAKPSSTTQSNPDPDQPNSTSQNFLDPTSLLLSTSFVFYLLAWFVCVLFPLIFGFHWRWSIGSFFACFFWGPIGLLFALYVSWLVLIRSYKISTYSPRDLMREFASNPVITTIIVIALIGLTAVSILGGFIIIGIIYFYFQFSLLFMPSGTEQPAYAYAPLITSGSESTISTSYNDNYSTGDSDYNSSYDDDRNRDDGDDDDDDDDNNDKGSAWDGWLVKW